MTPPNKITFPDELDEIVLHLLKDHHGREKPIQREVLLQECQQHQVCTDSEMRLAIQFLRDKGHRICNMKDGRGYFIASTYEEYKAFRDKYGQVAFSTLATIKAMDEYAPEQMGMELE